jgi:phosphoribosyl-ATP pyrophosphohydrolase/phosphoribosyl-AMP cyclohydrolase
MMEIDFRKYSDGLVPAVVQDAGTGRVLMVGFMNERALEETLATHRVTFFSRSRNELWTKGETSGNYLDLVEIKADCDNDTLLLTAKPAGPVCHTGKDTCFGEANRPFDFVSELEAVILDRKTNPNETSYTSSLFSKGIDKIAQKVGEEAVELIIEAKGEDETRFKEEASDLLYHLLVLFAEKNVSLADILTTLRSRR